MPRLEFPAGFLWGAATSAYQIEGAWTANGKGESIWDRFSHTPGKILNGDTGDIACDHYHRWQEDVALMQSLGLQAYRFSTAWTRILPTGRKPVNPPGLDFYDRLVDALLKAGITPFLNLFHWDLPQALQETGGWAERDTAAAFADYADVVSRALGDRVKHWITHNEITCASFNGYQQGRHAPGLTDWTLALRATHHLLLSHGLAVMAIRANVPGCQVGMVMDDIPAEPATADPADVAAYRWYDGYHNRWFMDPLYGRGYPADMVADYIRRGYLPGGLNFVLPPDLEVIASPTDFIGLNYYRRAVLRQDSPATVAVPRPSATHDEFHTDNGWEIFPQGLYNLIMHTHLHYRPAKIYVSENGASFGDRPGSDGRVRDWRRIEFLRSHLAATHHAIQCGAPVQGYFVWSLLDNFEWALGYSQRFGIIWVDHSTQQRIPKDSARWYRQVIQANSIQTEPEGDAFFI